MTRRDEIFEVLCDYADAHLGNSPSIRDLLKEMHKRGYKMSKGTLQVHLVHLQADKRIDRVDGKLIVINSDWIRPEVFSDGQSDIVRLDI